jgi:hypothetical protein
MTAPLVSVLILGMTLNGLMSIPYALQLAHGWTSLSLRITILLIIFIVPANILMINWLGTMGAATVWVAMNGINILLGVTFTHRRLLAGEAWPWLSKDILPPMITALIVVGLTRLTVMSPMSSIKATIFLPSILVVTLAASAYAAPYIRSWLMAQLFRKSSSHS